MSREKFDSETDIRRKLIKALSGMDHPKALRLLARVMEQGPELPRPYDPHAPLTANRKLLLKNMYGLSESDYWQLFSLQSGRCAICKSTEPGSPSWNVDHDHVTGEVRGLLCKNCNHFLGFAKDDVDAMLSGILYLLKTPFQVLKERQSQDIGSQSEQLVANA